MGSLINSCGSLKSKPHLTGENSRGTHNGTIGCIALYTINLNCRGDLSGEKSYLKNFV